MQTNLENCDKEPIHLLGKIQSFGFLMGVTSEWIVTHASFNISHFIDVTPEEILNTPAENVLHPETLHAIRNKLQYLRNGIGTEFITGVSLDDSGRLFDISVHLSGKTIILECELHHPGQSIETDLSNVRGIIERLRHAPSLENLYSNAVRFIKLLTGMDRVMLYKFLMDDSGEVIAEAKSDITESFLSLRYPASDIPKQARKLYSQNPFRIIVDVEDEGYNVSTLSPSSNDVLDLSNSVFRSVSPIHLQYLRNMGVRASMSISIIIDNKLWGLIACHHSKPNLLSHSKRNAALLFSQMFSLVLQSKLSDETRLLEKRTNEAIEEILCSIKSNDSKDEVLNQFAEKFLHILRADGVAIVLQGSAHTIGVTPSKSDISKILTYLKSKSDNQIFATNELRSHISEADRFMTQAAGLLSVPISKKPIDFVIFFRKEVIQSITWAGDPTKPLKSGLEGDRLTPRKSFEAWQELVAGRSEDWLPDQLHAARQLRITLLEVVLRFTNVAIKEKKAVNEKQELLIAELNHRVRNILGLVRGLISQTANKGLSISEYTNILDSRIQALARAHDQITRANWTPSSITDLIKVEAESYLLDKYDRVIISGRDVALSPVAFSTMALVIHEMLTNAAKYGALSDTRGTVNIKLIPNKKEGLTINWEESGGPEVSKPDRRGFGSTIIERSIPFELHGTAEVAYEKTGLRAKLLIPAIHISFENALMPSNLENEPEKTKKFTVPNRVLILEDNLIISLEAEEIFKTLGSKEVTILSTNEQAFDHISKNGVDFCLLDVNLGIDTSVPFAEEIARKNIPFAFATGYGEAFNCPEFLKEIPCIPKPYDIEMIQSAIATYAENVGDNSSKTNS